jgi:dodecin
MDCMSIVKIIKLIGSSPKSWEEATKNALDEAANTSKNIKSIYVKRCIAKVENNKITKNDFLPKILYPCPFTEEICTINQRVECLIFIKSANKQH